MKKNEHYWKPGLPKIDTITYRSVPENGARIAMLQAGEAQFIYPVPPEMIKLLENSPTITVFNEPSILIRYVALNNMRKPFNDPRVRQALNYAVDKQAFAKVVFSGYADPMDSPMPPRLGLLPEAGQLSVRSGEGQGAAGRGRLSERLREHDHRPSAHARAARHAVRAAAACRGRCDDEGRTAGGRRADGEDFNVQKPEDATIVMRLCRLVVLDRRRRLGHAADALQQVVPAGAGQPRLVQQSGDGCGDRGGACARSIRRSAPAAYAKAQAQVWKDAPWIFLGVDHNLAAYSKKLHGAFMRPDQQFHLATDASLD